MSVLEGATILNKNPHLSKLMRAIPKEVNFEIYVSADLSGGMTIETNQVSACTVSWKIHRRALTYHEI